MGKSFWLAIAVGVLTLFGVMLFAYRLGQKNPAPQTPSSTEVAPLSKKEEVLSQLPPVSHIPKAKDVCSNFHAAICLHNDVIHDPSGSVRKDAVGELVALRMYEEILRQNPDWDSAQVDNELVNEIYTVPRRKKIQGVFDWVVHEEESFIDAQPHSVFSSREKKLLKGRLKKIQLQLPPPASLYADEPNLFTKNDVLYERFNDGSMWLRVGGAYLINAKSWFNMVFTMAHELGHSIDPCEMRAVHQSFPAYDRLTACFVHQRLVQLRDIRTECGENDQLSETFADWMAVQITGKALIRYAREFDHNQMLAATLNSVIDLCDQDENLFSGDDSVHPSPKVRIDKIFGQNSMIREVLGCGPLSPKPGHEYCTLEWKVPQAFNGKPFYDNK